ncbi:hypothetical protein CYMTET_28254, partial [Cymbomonas tetramitiformis]
LLDDAGRLEVGEQDILCVEFLPGQGGTAGRSFVTGNMRGQLGVWEQGRLIKLVDGHQGALRCMRISPNGREVITGGESGEVLRWEVKGGKLWGMTGALPLQEGLCATHSAEMGHRTESHAHIWCMDWKPDSSGFFAGTTAGDIWSVNTEVPYRPQ